jgi:beta-glucosidase-like glycosyl hydrolase
MSRSFKHFPLFGHTNATSEKEYKVAQHRIERARVRTAIANGNYEAAEVLMASYNSWDAPSDGKFYYTAKVQMGFGIHNPPTENWSPEANAKRLKKSLRK